MARQLGIPTILERCNAHTEFAYKVVQDECDKLGIVMPKGHEHEFNPRILANEIKEFNACDFLLSPSEFVSRTFTDRGFNPDRLLRFQYGFDPATCFPRHDTPRERPGLTALFAAGCAPRKGLHLALRAWLGSTASKTGTLLVAGEFIPGYAECLSKELAHPSIRLIGFRKDLPEIMRSADIFVLPSIEEGSALVTYDARACGCVLVVSDATGAVCSHAVDALVHPAGEVSVLTEHISKLNDDRKLLADLRAKSLAGAGGLSWAASGPHILAAYRTALDRFTSPSPSTPSLN